MLPTLLTT